jgi:hypothetical protein
MSLVQVAVLVGFNLPRNSPTPAQASPFSSGPGRSLEELRPGGGFRPYCTSATFPFRKMTLRSL